MLRTQVYRVLNISYVNLHTARIRTYPGTIYVVKLKVCNTHMFARARHRRAEVMRRSPRKRPLARSPRKRGRTDDPPVTIMSPTRRLCVGLVARARGQYCQGEGTGGDFGGPPSSKRAKPFADGAK